MGWRLDASDQLLCIDCRLRTTNAGGIRYPDTLLLPLSLRVKTKAAA